MKAMILAAGFGTRLHPLTATIPKALIPIAGTTVLELQLRRLEQYGITDVAVNAHHFAEQVKNAIDQIQLHSKLKIYYSYEPEILNTGGGIKKMLRFFDGDSPILVQNADIISSINYRKLYEYHFKEKPTATLVINNNQTDRPLAFTDGLNFLGRAGSHDYNIAYKPYCFCGIQVIQPELFLNVNDEKFYSMDLYCATAKNIREIRGYDITGEYWRDIGTIEDLKAAEQDFQNGILKF